MSDWLGSLIGGAFGLAGSLGSNAMSIGMSKELQEHQAMLNYRYAKKSAKNMPLYNRQGLETAGYNPMLALGNLQGAQSSWTASNALQSSDMSDIGNNAISNAISLKQQQNQNQLTTAQVDNYNADSILKNNQAVTQLYEQLEKLNHADLMKAQKQLTDKNTSWYDRQQAREDLRVANEIERTGNDFKVGMAQAIASQISANANQQMAISNSKDVKSRLPINEQEKEIRRWNAKHPVLSRLLPGSASAGISAGAAILK